MALAADRLLGGRYDLGKALAADRVLGGREDPGMALAADRLPRLGGSVQCG